MVPTKSNFRLFTDGMIDKLVGKELINILEKSDFNMFNLEVPLTDSNNCIDKFGVCLKAPKATINAYKALGVDFLTLANNHIMDFGEKGAVDTINVLNEANIAYAGIGCDIHNIKSDYMFENNGCRIGIYCCVEHEFSVASTTCMGANPYRKLNSYLAIKDLKEKCDKIIVLYHGGKEHYRFPSVELQANCRELVDAGADVIICQHSHCVGCEEKYKDSVIVYGQGNFLFDEEENEYWNSGLLVQVNDDFSVSYIPVVKKKETVRLANEKEKALILREFYERSKMILDPGTVQAEYNKFANEMLFTYLYTLSGFRSNILLRVVNKLTKNRFGKWYLFKKYNKQNLLMLQNYLECEAHRELFTAGVKNRIRIESGSGTTIEK